MVEIMERARRIEGDRNLYETGKITRDFVLSDEEIRVREAKRSAQDLIEEARKARELDERQEA